VKCKRLREEKKKEKKKRIKKVKVSKNRKGVGYYKEKKREK
jgi:hypothetical protein